MSEYEYETVVDGFRVGVNKVGGGTLGDKYTQEDWRVTVWSGPEIVFDEELLYLGSPATHEDAASVAAGFASHQSETENY